MNPQDFVTQLRESVIDDNSRMDMELFLSPDTSAATDPYWKRAHVFFDSLTYEQQVVFFEITRQVAVDTTSNILGVLDGVCSFGADLVSFDVIVDGENIAGDLQDLFLVGEEERAEQRELALREGLSPE